MPSAYSPKMVIENGFITVTQWIIVAIWNSLEKCLFHIARHRFFSIIQTLVILYVVNPRVFSGVISCIGVKFHHVLIETVSLGKLQTKNARNFFFILLEIVYNFFKEKHSLHLSEGQEQPMFFFFWRYP